MVQLISTENNRWTLPEPETTDLAQGKRAIKSKDIDQQKRLKSSSVQTTKQWSLASNEKFKASNFPAALLKIGNWEWVSKYEGDLVGKCYFAKQKLIWEVLDGKLKSKIEIQWGDIVGLKANCPDNGPGTLTIVLGKQPRFYKEIDPQPRKHTIWQPTSDFTGGEASTCWKHYLQCSQGVLNKHYEKLIQCDTRLNFLSQQVDTFLDSPFAAKDSIKDPNVLNNNDSNQPEMSKGPVVSCIKNTGPLDLVHGGFMEEYGHVGSLGFVGSKAIEKVNASGPQGTMVSRVLPVYNNPSGGVYQNQLMKNNSHIGLLQDGNESNDYSDPNTGNYQIQEWHDGNDHISLYCNLMPENENENENGMSREDDLIYQLPKIASLPELSIETSHDGENENGMSRVDSFSDMIHELSFMDDEMEFLAF